LVEAKCLLSFALFPLMDQLFSLNQFADMFNCFFLSLLEEAGLL